jgi:hypothetical protein
MNSQFETAAYNYCMRLIEEIKRLGDRELHRMQIAKQTRGENSQFHLMPPEVFSKRYLGNANQKDFNPLMRQLAFEIGGLQKMKLQQSSMQQESVAQNIANLMANFASVYHCQQIRAAGGRPESHVESLAVASTSPYR